MQKTWVFNIGALLVLLVSTTAHAQWIRTSVPLPIQVFAISVKGGDVLVGTDSAVYHSSDGGLTWIRPANSGMQSKEIVYALAFKDSFVFAGSNSNGVFRSKDLGMSWQSTSTGLPSGQAFCFVVKDSFIFVGTSNHGVYTSTDNGSSWIPVNSGMTTAYVSSMTVVSDSLGGTYILAGTVFSNSQARGGVFRTTDSGTSWQPVNVGLVDSSVYALATGGVSELYAATFGHGVYHSTDYGLNWQAVNSGLGNLNVISLLAVNNTVLDSAVIAGTFGSGVYASTNRGSSWVPFGLQTQNINALSVSTSYLFGGISNNGGVYRRPFTTTSVEIDDLEIQPQRFVLEQNFPNPFNPSTKIRYGLITRAKVTLKVYSVLGQEVETLIEAEQSAGFHEVSFNGDALSSGMYFYKLQVGKYAVVKKLMLLR